MWRLKNGCLVRTLHKHTVYNKRPVLVVLKRRFVGVARGDIDTMDQAADARSAEERYAAHKDFEVAMRQAVMEVTSLRTCIFTCMLCTDAITARNAHAHVAPTLLSVRLRRSGQ
jgi:hypothetical protein